MKELRYLVFVLCFSCTKKEIDFKMNFKDKTYKEIEVVNLENEDKSEVYILNSDSTYTFLNYKDLTYNFGRIIPKDDLTEFVSVPMEKFNFLKSINSNESKHKDIEIYFHDKTGILIDDLPLEVYNGNDKTDLLAVKGMIKLKSVPDSISIPVFQNLSGLKHSFVLTESSNSFDIYFDLNHQVLKKFFNYKVPDSEKFVMYSPLKELLK